MTTPAAKNYYPHALVTFGGRLGTVSTWQDSWQSGIRIVRSSGGTGAGGQLNDPGAYLTSLQASLKTWFQQAKSSTTGSEAMGMRSDAYLDWVKVNNIKTDGTYADAITHVYDYSPAGQGSTSATNLPTFVTAAISWTTGVTRGPAHRGRIYLPLAIVGPSINDQLASIEQTECLKTGKGLLSTLTAITDAGTAVQPIVCSAKAQMANVITGISVGNVYDVQRRRKNQLPETYVSLAFP